MVGTVALVGLGRHIDDIDEKIPDVENKNIK
jgi:hypothetical protein